MKRVCKASLKDLNSFAVEATANELLILESEADLKAFARDVRFNPSCDLILGRGSNILFANDVQGTVVLIRNSGKRIANDSGKHVIIEASSGENWHELVLWSLQQGLSGIENLSLIPGLAGAAPIQNIGAYGVELADVLDSVQALDLTSGEFCEFSKDDCHFSYRDSRFKTANAGQYLITAIRLSLRRDFDPILGYAGISDELKRMGIAKPTAKYVSDAVIRIRQRKLPDPEIIGNAGSFFKNPIVSRQTAEQLRIDNTALPTYPAGQGNTKLSAAWLIEKCGWKGRSMGQAAVSDQHSLVLINRGEASGQDILALATAIQASVKDQFGIELQAEPRVI